tara:strand:- start:54 stop:170 length:117 start_codon:yes stop_codon:yes gene_type:complete
MLMVEQRLYFQAYNPGAVPLLAEAGTTEQKEAQHGFVF